MKKKDAVQIEEKSFWAKLKNVFTFNFLKELRWYEWLIIAVITISQLVLTILTETSAGTAIFNYSISLSGFLYVVCASRCSFWIFVFGLYQPLAYGFVCLNAQVYGEMIVNFAYFAPMQIVGIVLWLRNLKNKQKEIEISIKSLKPKAYLYLVPLISALYVGVYFLLTLVDGQRLPFLDAFISVMSVLGTLLLTLRFKENWYAYLLVNVASSVLWLLLTIQGEPNAPYILILNIAYVIYSMIGLFQWNKKEKQTKHNQLFEQEKAETEKNSIEN